ncbi:hypothetical protein [Haloferax volcanii]|uniref:Uncharacterized protein n=1 Tax=Haloferax volcanii TaxID=2246 RepID=A0A558GAH1_HALVO|nr:hypothetical protein [Haloferax volcanii]TVT94772.1 hypothetical protein FQA18_10055 [Haloferax volcanii]
MNSATSQEISASKMRTTKVLISVVSVSISYFMLLSAFHPNRVTSDENYVVNDLFVLLDTGHLSEPAAYWNGNAYQFISVTLLRVTGLNHADLELLSPLIGSLVVGLFAVVGVLVARYYVPQGQVWAGIVTPAAVMIFGGYVLRLTESTHKRFTFTLILLVYLLVARQLSKSRQTRKPYLLILGFLLAISLFNVVWSLIYGFVAFLVLAVSKFSTGRVVAGASLVAAVSFTLSEYLPTMRIPWRYPRQILAAFLVTSPSTSASGSAGFASGMIASWEPITLVGFTFSSWFLFSSGIFFVIVVSGVVYIRAFSVVLRNWFLSAIETFYLGLSTWFLGLSAVLLVMGDVATFKRLIVLPGVFSCLYAVYLLFDSSWISPRTRRVALSVLVCGLLVGSALAIPRATLDGDPSPYDYYADQSQTSKFVWYDSYGGSDPCLRSHEFVDPYLSAEVFGPDRPNAEPSEVHRFESRVYSSGGDAYLTCDS